MTTPSSTTLSPILITGGCGFIGFHIARRLRQDDAKCQVHVLDVNVNRRRIPGVIYHACDISSADAVNSVLQEAKPRTIFHCASPVSMIIRPKLFDQVNVIGTRNLLAAAAKVGTVRALVNTSTSSVVHDNLTDLLDADETLPVLRPPAQKRFYSLSKATAEADVLAANRADGPSSMLTVSLRPALVFGESDATCLGKMVAVARTGKMRFQIGDGKNVFDVIYIDNLVDAHLLAAAALLHAYGQPSPSPEVRVDGECFNITDERILFWDFSRKVAAAAGHPVKPEEIVVIPVLLGLIIGWISEWLVWIWTRGATPANLTREGIRFSTMHRTLNGDKAKRVLKYQPRISVNEGIVRGVKWFNEHDPEGKLLLRVQ